MTRFRAASRLLFGLLLTGAGLNHFLSPDFYLRIMPDYLPAHGALVALSGVFEVAIGVSFFVARLNPYSGYLAVALLVAVFPANVHMALNPADYSGLPAPALWLRLPLQLLLVLWALWCTRAEPRTDNASPSRTAETGPEQ